MERILHSSSNTAFEIMKNILRNTRSTKQIKPKLFNPNAGDFTDAETVISDTSKTGKTERRMEHADYY